MKRINIALTIFSMLVCFNAYSSVDPKDNGLTLMKNCINTAKLFKNQAVSDGGKVEAGLCLGFIRGISQMGENVTKSFCPKDGVTLEQKFWVVVDFLKSHKENLGSSAGLMVFKALKNEYPCD